MLGVLDVILFLMCLKKPLINLTDSIGIYPILRIEINYPFPFTQNIKKNKQTPIKRSIITNTIYSLRFTLLNVDVKTELFIMVVRNEITDLIRFKYTHTHTHIPKLPTGINHINPNRPQPPDWHIWNKRSQSCRAKPRKRVHVSGSAAVVIKVLRLRPPQQFVYAP